MKKFLTITLCLQCILLCTAYAQPSPDVKQLQQILKATRGSWTAAENFITTLRPEDQEAYLGLIPVEAPPGLEPEVMPFKSRRTSYMTEHTAIRAQGKCGSCYAFGVCAAYEGFKLKTEKVEYDLSEQDLMMKAARKDWSGIIKSGGCKGYSLNGAISLLNYKGVLDESQCRYKASHYYKCPDLESKHRISRWGYTRDANTMKYALENYGPVFGGFAVYSDFLAYKSGYYEYTTGSLKGYHAIAIVGYDSEGWIVKNSWGTRWGEKGFFKIKYNQMNGKVQFGVAGGGSYYIKR